MDPSKFSKAITPICSMTLDLPPSCIEFVPGFPEWFVVGTYNLQKEVDTGSQPQSRTGSLSLFRTFGDELTLVQTVSHPSAILDLHFLPNDSRFGVVSSTGSVSIYSFQVNDHRISHLTTHQAFDNSLLILSFTWYPSQTQSSKYEPLLAVTLSNGSVHLLQFSSNFNSLEVLNNSEPLNAHTLEAWTCAFSSRHLEVGSIKLYSGGDDGKLRLVEMESLPTTSEAEIQVTQSIPQTIFRGHEAGVTAILPLPTQSSGPGDILLTGSYDDHVRVYTTYDSRPGARNTTGKVLTELKIGGGVWRLKFLDGHLISRKETGFEAGEDGEVKLRVLASCMHAGARILEVKRSKGEDGEWSIDILGSVTVHESMCYGSDVQPDVNANHNTDTEELVVSTSFYDRLICVWKFDPQAI